MRNIATVIMLALLGAAATMGYLKWKSSPVLSPPPASPSLGAANAPVAPEAHGKEISATQGAVLCATHRIPEGADAFCHPDLVETLGFCREHGVPEAFCTRCSPILIAAFKAERDWCERHSVPQSQCATCQGG